MIDQGNVATLMPPGVSCWRGNCRREWWAHVKPYKRIFEAVDRNGLDESATVKALIRRAWALYLEREALPESAGPVKDMFREASTVASASST